LLGGWHWERRRRVDSRAGALLRHRGIEADAWARFGCWHVPEINHPGGLLGVGGPMARSARDVRVLFEALAGYDSQDPFSAPVPLRQPDLAGLRIGVMEQFYQVPVEPGVREAVRKAAAVLGELGFAVEPWQPTGLERAPNLWWFFFGILPARFTQKLIEGREDQAHWTGTEFLHQALAEPDPSA